MSAALRRCNRCGEMRPVTTAGTMTRHVRPPAQRAAGFICTGSGQPPWTRVPA